MLLNYADFQLFHKLHRALLFVVNQRLQVIPDNVSSPDASTSLAPEACLKLQEALATHTDLIQQFVDENPFQLASDELAIVRSWRHVVYGDFYVFRQLKKYTLFLSVKDQPVVYGVVGLSQPIEELIGRRLPAQAKALLLPFKEMIVHDGLLAS